MGPNLKLHHLRDFVAIAQHQSVRGAARSLGLAQPSLTRSLGQLERELGVSLVDRHARGVVLTEAGKRFAQRASSALNDIRRAGEELGQLAGQSGGSVAVMLSTTPMLALAPYAVPRFRRAHPSVALRIFEGTFPAAEPRLADGELDFYAGAAPLKVPPHFRRQVLFRNERVVLARKGHPLAGATRLKQLKDADWVQTGLRDGEFEEIFDSFGLQAPASRLRIESILGLLMVISASDCITALPRQWTEIPMFRGVLATIPIKEKLPAPDIVLLSRAGIPLTPAAEEFAVQLERAIGKPFSPSARAGAR